MTSRRVTDCDAASGRLSVVVVNAEFPYPPNAGNRIRTLNLLERLAPRHQITFIARRGDPDETGQAIEYLEKHGIRTIVVDQQVPRKSGWTFRARLAANLLSTQPYSVIIARRGAVAPILCNPSRPGTASISGRRSGRLTSVPSVVYDSLAGWWWLTTWNR